ncbi:aldo/keto reductase [Oscillospiraceae bacterium OttesenSCG-928-F05]|nr:aldo/keto reductase [Oscillospiraceae bacterium OttesenSCG-928-F05]
MYQPEETRYDSMTYNRCGRSGVKLSALALGLWQNFGGDAPFENSRQMIRQAFDAGITYFDLANNYGPPYGSAEETFGLVMERDMRPYRDEMFVATKAGYDMWPGPYGNWGSKKYLVSSLDQSLKRMKLDYVDLFYHHRHDPETPLEETMDALVHILRQGKALYVGISNYGPEETRRAADILEGAGVHLLAHQMRYSMLNRTPEAGLFQVLEEKGIGGVCFSCLQQGILTDKYFRGIPGDSRAGGPSISLNASRINKEEIDRAKKLNVIAGERGQSLAQMALQWAMRPEAVTGVILGVSRPEQIAENLKLLKAPAFSAGELAAIEGILK